MDISGSGCRVRREPGNESGFLLWWTVLCRLEGRVSWKSSPESSPSMTTCRYVNRLLTLTNSYMYKCTYRMWISFRWINCLGFNCLGFNCLALGLTALGLTALGSTALRRTCIVEDVATTPSHDTWQQYTPSFSTNITGDEGNKWNAELPMRSHL